MELELLDKIKRLVIVALVSDDELMDTLVIKGMLSALPTVSAIAARSTLTKVSARNCPNFGEYYSFPFLV